jgi:hypothetical protein
MNDALHQLQTPPLSRRDHRPCGVAILPVPFEPALGRGNAAGRGIVISYETIRRWGKMFDPSTFAGCAGSCPALAEGDHLGDVTPAERDSRTAKLERPPFGPHLVRQELELGGARNGTAGLYPFDLLAAVFVIKPQQFACARVTAGFGRDETLNFPFNPMPGLLVEGRRSAALDLEARAALYCFGVREGSGSFPTWRKANDIISASSQGHAFMLRCRRIPDSSCRRPDLDV